LGFAPGAADTSEVALGLGGVSEATTVSEAAVVDVVAELTDVAAGPDTDGWPTACPAACGRNTVLAITAPATRTAAVAVTAIVVPTGRRRLVPNWSLGTVGRGAPG
jgi:hypothetical protein